MTNGQDLGGKKIALLFDYHCQRSFFVGVIAFERLDDPDNGVTIFRANYIAAFAEFRPEL